MESIIKRKFPEVSYIQGLNFITVELGRNLNEENSFLILMYIHDCIFQPYFFREMKGLQEFLSLICKILESKYFEMYNKLKINEDLLRNFLLSWVVCLFMNLDFQQKWNVVKFIVVFKKAGIVRVLLYIFKKIYKKLKKSENFMEFNEELKKVGWILNNKKILKKLYKVKLNSSILKIIDEFNLETNKKDYRKFTIYRNQDILNLQNFNKNYFLTKKVNQSSIGDREYSEILNYQKSFFTESS